MKDEISGYAAPAPDVRVRSPDLVDRIKRLFALEAVRPQARTHSVSFRGAQTLIRFTSRAARPEVLFELQLPTFVRGRFLATYEDFLTEETFAPIEPHEISREGR